ncbi:MAG: hypothetical protein PHX83_12070 [Acidobacteriia bacterium]|nr:hypothetical protein [Terriglobia bacterium]
MTYKERFCAWLNRSALAEDATLSTFTGSTCRCMASRDTNNPSFSAQWHRDNPSATACNGLGLYSTTEATTPLSFVITEPISMISGNIPINKEWLSQIGEIQKTDRFVWGTVNRTSGAFVDLSGKSEYHDYITYDSNKYLIRDVTDLPGDAGQVAHLVRRES